MKKALFAAALTGIMVFWAIAASAELKDTKARESYTIGYQFGTSLRQQEFDIDLDLLISAMKDGLKGTKGELTPEEMSAVIDQLRQKLAATAEKREQALAETNLAEGKAYMAANAKKEDVKTLPSGLQYTIIREGDGPKPKENDMVTVNYAGAFINGTEFDSTYKRNKPATVKLGSIISGWREALPMMKTGAKWHVVIPPDLAYGDKQAGPIPPNSTLVFDIELISIGIENAPSKPVVKPAE